MRRPGGPHLALLERGMVVSEESAKQEGGQWASHALDPLWAKRQGARGGAYYDGYRQLHSRRRGRAGRAGGGWKACWRGNVPAGAESPSHPWLWHVSSLVIFSARLKGLTQGPALHCLKGCCGHPPPGVRWHGGHGLAWQGGWWTGASTCAMNGDKQRGRDRRAHRRD